VGSNPLAPYGVKAAFAGKDGKHRTKFLRNLQIKEEAAHAASSFICVLLQNLLFAARFLL
jgi:hypothetical protein